MIKTREQDYAAKIYDQVGKVKGKNFQDDYKNAAKNLPFLIRSAGLVQALYFMQTRNEGAKTLIKHLANIIEKPTETLAENELKALAENFLAKVRTKPINEYIFLTEKCLLALKWYKRFVDIHIEDKDKKTAINNEVKKDVYTP
jgi:CRISPR type III-B/RAMP module-associated protein Cmr5